MKWEKLGHIFDPTKCEDRPRWRWDYAQGINSIRYDKFIRVYFCCREKLDSKNRTVSRVSYVDLDCKDPRIIKGISSHPVLDVGETGTFDEFGMYPFSAIRHEGKIYGYYGGITRCESVPFNVSIGCVISEDDGEKFHRIGKGPILTYSLDEPYVIASPKVRQYDGKWYLFYSAGRNWLSKEEHPEIYYKLRMATSEDGINWIKCGKDIVQDKLGQTEAQACADTFYKNGKYHMFFCYRNSVDFRRNKENSYRIGYASSTDLMHWERDDSKAGIDISENIEAFDSEMVAYPHIFEVEDNLYMLYLGNEVGKYGFGLAKLAGGAI